MTTSCPNCGAELTLRFASMVCRQCRTVVARAEGGVRSLGQAALFESRSQLALGAEGMYGGYALSLIGHVQFKHPAGGVWDEWYVSLSDGRCAWLAEAQGKFYLAWYWEQSVDLPPYESIYPGLRLWLPAPDSPDGMANYTVNEKGEAQVLAAEGDIPYVLTPGASYRFVDLTGANKEFATIAHRESVVFRSSEGDATEAYREAPTASPSTQVSFYVGREVQLSELGLSPSIEALSSTFNCPSCQTALTPLAPGRTERMVCHSCGSFVDVTQGGDPQLAGQAERPAGTMIPLGKTARFEDGNFTIIGYLRRSGLFDGERFGWDEYLLYHPSLGFRWLVFGEDGWSYVTPVNPGEVEDYERRAVYKGSTYSLKDRFSARVDQVLGEFYWKVSVGETVEVSDFKSWNDSLSKEGTGNEIVWSFGKRITPADVELAVGMDLGLPKVNSLSSDGGFSSSSSSDKSGQIIFWGIFIMIIILIISIDSCDGGGGGGGVFVGGFRGGK